MRVADQLAEAGGLGPGGRPSRPGAIDLRGRPSPVPGRVRKDNKAASGWVARATRLACALDRSQLWGVVGWILRSFVSAWMKAVAVGGPVALCEGGINVLRP